jgi:chorismate lyase
MPINTFLITPFKAQCSKQFLEWISYQNPLTDKLQKAKGEATLEFLSQEWKKTDEWSHTLLEIHDELVFQREIIMKSHGVTYWYARSIIPKRCYDIDPSFFDRLQQESIKYLIFGNEQVLRINFVTYPIDSDAFELSWVKKYIENIEGILWVRISEFSFQNLASFYLIEIMLPELGEIAS